MASLYTKTKLYIEDNSSTWDHTKVSLQNDGSGDYIKTWTYSFDKPNDSKIAEYETAGNTGRDIAVKACRFPDPFHRLVYNQK